MSPVDNGTLGCISIELIFLFFQVFADLITFDTCADKFMFGSETALRILSVSVIYGTVTPFYAYTRYIKFCPDMSGIHY